MITCSWEKPIGTCVYVDEDGNQFDRIIWGGGNCLAIITTPKRQLECFFIDKAHMKKCVISVNSYYDYCIFGDRKTESRTFMDALAQMGKSFLYCPTSKGCEHIFEIQDID